MTQKTVLLILVSTVILITSVATVILLNKEGQEGEYQPGENLEFDAAVNQAKYIYSLREKEGIDFSKGPCLTNALMPGWVLDLVHNPRETVDDLPANQCNSFLEGSAKHFVELDTKGNFVRAR